MPRPTQRCSPWNGGDGVHQYWGQLSLSRRALRR
nr:MAG TPA: Cas system-associated protein [Caudoviricetes sp.]